MTIATLTLTYGVDQRQREEYLNLEQMPVPSAALTLDDLEQMLALVRSGTSARAYRQPTCPVTIVAGEIRVPVTVWVWPSTMSLNYELHVAAGVLGPRSQIEQEREFDLVIAFESRVMLPFYCRQVTWTWTELPCWDRFGREVPYPTIRATPTALMVDAEVLTVIRVRCLAVGYAHQAVVAFPKSSTDKILDVRNTATALWQDGEQTTTIDLQYPPCASDMLAACEDGTLIRDHAVGEVIDEEDRIPVIYYNDCTGSVLAVRYELP